MDDLEPESDEESSGGGAAWMATFADMMTLLLCFFILLLSFATMDVVKFREALGSVQEALGVQFEHDGQFEAVASSPVQLDDFEANGALLEDRALLDELTAAIAEEGLDDQIGAEIDGRGVVVRINGQVLYQQGDAALKPASDAILARIASLVRGTEHRVMIEGHTDDVPIQTARYPSNWELSAARAIAAMRFLVDHNVDSERIGVAGYADQRPFAPNDGPDNRAANRRVEFVFIREAPPEGAEGSEDAEDDAQRAADATSEGEIAEGNETDPPAADAVETDPLALDQEPAPAGL
jgi:chemotaxis protein MotB